MTPDEWRELQWGRVPEDAEITYSVDKAGNFMQLQWGRVPEDAEIARVRVQAGEWRRASMGPRP